MKKKSDKRKKRKWNRKESGYDQTKTIQMGKGKRLWRRRERRRKKAKVTEMKRHDSPSISALDSSTDSTRPV